MTLVTNNGIIVLSDEASKSDERKGEYRMLEVMDEMTEKEQKTMFISAYMNLQRVKVSQDKDKEIRNQERELKAKLEALGVVVEDLTIE